MPQVTSSYTCPETGKEKTGTFFIASSSLARAKLTKKQFRVVGKNVFIAPKSAPQIKEKSILDWVVSQDSSRPLKEVQAEIRRRALQPPPTSWVKASPVEEKKYREAVAQIRKIVEAHVRRRANWYRKLRRLALIKAVGVMAANQCFNLDQARARVSDLSVKL